MICGQILANKYSPAHSSCETIPRSIIHSAGQFLVGQLFIYNILHFLDINCIAFYITCRYRGRYNLIQPILKCQSYVHCICMYIYTRKGK